MIYNWGRVEERRREARVQGEFRGVLPGGSRPVGAERGIARCDGYDSRRRICDLAHGTPILASGVGVTAMLINPVAFSHGYDRLRFIGIRLISGTTTSCLSNGRLENDDTF